MTEELSRAQREEKNRYVFNIVRVKRDFFRQRYPNFKWEEEKAHRFLWHTPLARMPSLLEEWEGVSYASRHYGNRRTLIELESEVEKLKENQKTA